MVLVSLRVISTFSRTVSPAVADAAAATYGAFAHVIVETVEGAGDLRCGVGRVAHDGTDLCRHSSIHSLEGFGEITFAADVDLFVGEYFEERLVGHSMPPHSSL